MAEPKRTLRISIPDAVAVPVERRPASIVIALMREEGVDPWKAGSNPMAVQIMQAWARGEHTEEQVRHMLRNLLILNPNLRGT